MNEQEYRRIYQIEHFAIRARMPVLLVLRHILSVATNFSKLSFIMADMVVSDSKRETSLLEQI